MQFKNTYLIATLLAATLLLTACHHNQPSTNHAAAKKVTQKATGTQQNENYYYINKRSDIKAYCEEKNAPARCDDIFALCVAYYDKYSPKDQQLHSARSRRHLIQDTGFFNQEKFRSLARSYNIDPKKIKQSNVKTLPLFCHSLLIKSGVQDNVISNVADGVASTTKTMVNTAANTAKQVTNKVTRTLSTSTD
jgi:hypothetical protein